MCAASHAPRLPCSLRQGAIREAVTTSCRRVVHRGVARLPLIALLVCGLIATGCSGRHSNVVAPMPGTVPSTPVDRVIAAVVGSAQGRAFALLPRHPGRQPGGIPEGGPSPGRLIKGTCTTQFVARSGYSGQTLVVFAETWPWRAFHYAGKRRRPQHHRWTFVVGPNRQVLS